MRSLGQRLFLTIANLVLLSYPTSFTSGAPEHFVFGMKTEVPMSDKDNPRKDYYLNIGLNQGVKTGSILDVYRTVTTSDDINNRSAQNILFKIARVKVIHAEGDISVARTLEIVAPTETPIGNYQSVVVGDRVAISGR